MNPRLCLSLQETGDVVMALNQHTAMDPKVIGFTGYPLSPSSKYLYQVLLFYVTYSKILNLTYQFIPIIM